MIDAAPLLPFFALYAETHYRPFRWCPSLLFRRQPEIVFDAPRRAGPGLDLPVSLLVNDIDRFPTRILEVVVAVNRPGAPAEAFRFEDPARQEIDHPLRFQSRAFVFRIPRARLPEGRVFVNARATVQCGRRRIDVLNDNLPGSSQAPFECRVADAALPGADCCVYGDMHVHTQFSQSHVEFGPPVALIAEMAKAFGMGFFAATDHSYDLACRLDNYLAEDPAVPRWASLAKSIDAAASIGPIILRGEEVSCLNARGRTVHACALGTQDFIAGSMDGARIDKKHTGRFTIPALAAEVHRQGGLLAAAHPRSRFGWAQRLLLHRGYWTDADFAEKIDGVQANDNGFLAAWEETKRAWIRELLRGRRMSIFAGCDCHGDFNRYRCLKVPLVNIFEGFRRHFGASLTGVYGRPRDQGQLIDSMRDGRVFVTDGPYLGLDETANPDSSIIGRQISRTCKSLTLTATSSCEFGPPRALRLLLGIRGEGAERVLFADSIGPGDGMQIRREVPTPELPEQGYLRAELLCESPEKGISRAFTSPCYLGS